MIGYSTGSGSGAEVERVREATRIAKERRPDLGIDGPLQYDAATIESDAKSKLTDSPVAGQRCLYSPISTLGIPPKIRTTICRGYFNWANAARHGQASKRPFPWSLGRRHCLHHCPHRDSGRTSQTLNLKFAITAHFLRCFTISIQCG